MAENQGLLAHPGPDSITDRAAWLEARRPGLTATEVRDLATGMGSHRERIMREKLYGAREDLEGIPAVEYGKLREPLIAEWIEQRFGITASSALYIHTADPRRLATPDGVFVTPFGDVLVSETKTSSKDLTPGVLDETNTLVLTKVNGRWQLDWENYPIYAKTGYYDQKQWQMFVMGAQQTLFAYEQHDGDWSGWPSRAPRALGAEPKWCWVKRDDKRIEELIAIADEFLEELEIRRFQLEQDGMAPESLDAAVEAVAAEEEDQELREKITLAGAEVLAARRERDEAEERRSEAQAALDKLLESAPNGFKIDDPRVYVSKTVSTSTKRVFNEKLAREKAAKSMEAFDKLKVRYTEETTSEKTTITVRAPKEES